MPIVGALLLTSVATLAVAALGLLSPLEGKLRSQELRDVTNTALAAAPRFTGLEATDYTGATPSKVLKHTVHSLVVLTGARVAVLTPQGRVIATSDPDESRNESVDDVHLATRRQHTVSSFGHDP